MDIQEQIEKGRKAHKIINMDLLTEGRFDHFVISSKDQPSKEKAIKAFWKDYESKSVPEGDIYWRRMPEYVVEEHFDSEGYYHIIRCRFSIHRG